MESLQDKICGLYSLIARVFFMIFCVVMPNGSFVRCPQEGNLISIGPGMYPSNRTLDGGGRSILVLGSCEFMHNGTLTGLNFYVASPDWMILQIWRPVSMDAVSMMLVYERMIEPNTSVDDITQLRFEGEELPVMEGDRIGFTKLNHTFPIPYVFNPQMSADLWYNRVPADISLPAAGDVITFEEMGFPYHFSVTVTFKAQVSKDPPVIIRPIHKHKPGNPQLTNNDVMKGDDVMMMGDSPAAVPGVKYGNPFHRKGEEEVEEKKGKDNMKNDKSVVLNSGTSIEDDKKLVDKVKPLVSSFDSTEEIDLENATSNQSVTNMLTQEASQSLVNEASVVLTTQSNVYSSESVSVDSQQPQEGSDSMDHTNDPEVLTTAGPKFIFDTVMQTFSKGIVSSEDPIDSLEEEDPETTTTPESFVTSQVAMEMSSVETDSVTDSDVTAESDDVVLTTEESASSSDLYIKKNSGKREEELPSGKTEN